MSNVTILETSRLLLRRLQQSDLEQLGLILGDAEVMYAWEHGFSPQEVADWLTKNLARYECDGYSYWAAILKESGLLIGVCGLLNEEAGCPGETEVGVAYILGKDYWHRGFALEGASACVRYAFETLGLGRVTAQIRPENAASRRVAERLGMTPEREFVKLYQGKEMPHLLYSLCTSPS